MKAAGIVGLTHLCWLARPRAERAVYRAVVRQRVRGIVELGVGSGGRACRMLRLALRYHRRSEISYVGVDLFEARGSGRTGPTLKQMHRLLAPSGVRVQLTPGEPLAALMRVANGLSGIGLLIVGADQDPASLDEAWRFVPRMLDERAVVLIEQRDASTGEPVAYERLGMDEVQRRAAAAGRFRRRAA